PYFPPSVLTILYSCDNPLLSSLHLLLDAPSTSSLSTLSLHDALPIFSGGMKRRLGIAQALLNDPEILIVDEPTAGLDPQERIRFRNLLSEISADRIVFLSTHIVSDIEYIAKEILLMKQGELIQQNTLEGLLEQVKGK